jgi:hypothetical protein
MQPRCGSHVATEEFSIEELPSARTPAWRRTDRLQAAQFEQLVCPPQQIDSRIDRRIVGAGWVAGQQATVAMLADHMFSKVADADAKAATACRTFLHEVDGFRHDIISSNRNQGPASKLNQNGKLQK